MRNFFGYLILISFCVGCYSNEREKISEKETTTGVVIADTGTNIVNLFYGTSEEVDTTNAIEFAMKYLTQSDYRAFLTLIKKTSQIDTFWHSGFFGFQVSNRVAHSKMINYALFEYESLLNNLPIEAQTNLLVNASFSPGTELYKLQEIESTVIENNKSRSKSEAERIIGNLSIAKKEFPRSKRLDFLLATQLLIFGDEKRALNIFDSLVEQNYCSLFCLRSIVDYSIDRRDLALQEIYLKKLKSRFPNECSLYASVFEKHKLDAETYKKCLGSYFQKDSIKANLAIAAYFLSDKKFESLDSMIDKYLKKYTEFRPDTFLLYERGSYFDIKMRSLFLREKYVELCKFANSEVGYNLVININNFEDFKQYIMSLYTKYVSGDLKKFDSFFNQRFSSCSF